MKLYSKVIGSGQPLIIMHGVFGMGDNWQTLGRRWSQSYEVHLLDMRNHGRSPHSDVFSYDAMSNDLLKYMDDLSMDKAMILGHSMGGKVGMQFSVLHDNRVEKLVVADIAPKAYQPHHQEIIQALQSLNLETIKSRGDAEGLFAIDDPGVKQFLLKSLYWKDKGQLDWRFNVPVIAREVEKVGEALPPNAIFQGPVLFVRGGASWYVQDDDMDEIEQHFPDALLETITGAGHWLHAEKPNEFFEVVNEFIEQ